MLDQWIAEAEPGPGSRSAVPELPRTTAAVAHTAARPAAPSAACPAGRAAGQAVDGARTSRSEAHRRPRALAGRWASEHADTPEEA
ncbi:DUF6457 domain-containing protein [Streptomyces sp. NPDC002514]|uniref:DUF6457 domain-containing protein n=1 Tax=unclassified Streptomyces TaxID=2593676 RepID=UPI003685D35E